MKSSEILYNGLRTKAEVIEEVIGKRGEVIRRLSRDEHARRPPRPCGMTVHPSYGCSFNCLYCYVKPAGKGGYIVNSLSGIELITALSLNPFFLPGEWGTLVAFGGITECFLNAETTSKTLEYMMYIRKRLGNPQQISTKAIPSIEAAKKIVNEADSNLSFLISITSLSLDTLLEPSAPPALKRIEMAIWLRKLGISTTIFLRPILPGITDRDFDYLIEVMRSHSVSEMIMGSLLVNRWIIEKLKAVYKNTMHREILNRATVIHERRLNPINESDLKTSLTQKAMAVGIKVFPSACSANIHSHGQACWMCRLGPCGSVSGLPIVDDAKELTEILELRVDDAWLAEDEKIYIKTRKPLDKSSLVLLSTATRRAVRTAIS